jgi:NTE family protein
MAAGRLNELERRGLMTINGNGAAKKAANGNGAAKTQVNVALQGGGSHGAFTWGVLDRLLEDGRLDIAAVSGTSAGAMNAVALADGWARGGAEGARDRLSEFWKAVARKGRFSPVQRSPWDMLLGNWSVENSPGYIWFDAMSRVFSPYVANPFDFNPLREVVEREVRFANIRSGRCMKLFVSATNVETGRLRVFENDEIGIDTVMASACLPHYFQAVEIDGVPYWDGGYGGNPAIYPFFYANAVEDVLLIQVNPVVREGTPRSVVEIQNRIDEITFNATLLSEFRAISFVKELIAGAKLNHADFRDIRMHRIDADAAFKDLSASSKINAEWAFLEYLRDLGRTAAEDWLEEHFDQVGKKSTLDLSEELQRKPKDAASARMGSRVRQFLATRLRPAGAGRQR